MAVAAVHDIGTSKDSGLTDRRRVGMELTDAIGALSLFLRGWGNYCRTGSTSNKFVQIDRQVVRRLKRLLIK